MANIKYNEFRKKYPNFIYDSYVIDDKDENIEIYYNFEIENLSKFTPKIIIPKQRILKYNKNIDVKNNLFKNLVFNLGMVELISYYKLTCSPNIIIKCGFLNKKQENFFKKLMLNGLGEFFYNNNIDVNDTSFVNITSSRRTKLDFKENTKNLKGQLVPIGGGKDSCVTLEVLESLRKTNTPFIINERGATLNTVDKALYNEEYISITRILDKEMLKRNAEGFLNGHTPFSAMLAFCSLIVAYLTDKKYIVLSNESSANEPSVIGSFVNHQYSKSFEFENDFREYEKEFLKTNIEYFSLLRPLNELQIAMLFSSFEKYHDIFRSCNVGSKSDIWCCNCSKCLFVYIILSPFLDEKHLIDIFKENILDKEGLYNVFLQLIGKTETKPFDCVGTYSEINYSICKTICNIKSKNGHLPFLLKKYFEDELDSKIEKAQGIADVYEKDLLEGYEANNLNEKFDKLLKTSLKRRKNWKN